MTGFERIDREEEPMRFEPGETLGYAIWDPATAGFVRSGFTGQTVFHDLFEAEEVAEPGMFVVRLEMEGMA